MTSTNQIKFFVDEIHYRFPEIESRVSPGDDELPYVIVVHLIWWLEKSAKDGLDKNQIDRVIQFYNWCNEQPRGTDASDDVMTIFMVGFYEHLFDHDQLLPLVPKLMSRKIFIDQREFLEKRIGKDRYEDVLRLFPRR